LLGRLNLNSKYPSESLVFVPATLPPHRRFIDVAPRGVLLALDISPYTNTFPPVREVNTVTLLSGVGIGVGVAVGASAGASGAVVGCATGSGVGVQVAVGVNVRVGCGVGVRVGVGVAVLVGRAVDVLVGRAVAV
jgi:hypothetical protein